MAPARVKMEMIDSGTMLNKAAVRKGVIAGQTPKITNAALPNMPAFSFVINSLSLGEKGLATINPITLKANKAIIIVSIALIIAKQIAKPARAAIELIGHLSKV